MIKETRTVFWHTARLVLVVSIISTVMVEKLLEERIPIMGSFMGLQRSFNTGVAFGLELGQFQSVLIGAALISVCWMAFKTANTRMVEIAFGLIVGGGTANIVDRLMDGQVTDVFQVGSFPIFNMADSAISIGVVLLLIDMTRSPNT